MALIRECMFATQVQLAISYVDAEGARRNFKAERATQVCVYIHLCMRIDTLRAANRPFQAPDACLYTRTYTQVWTHASTHASTHA